MTVYVVVFEGRVAGVYATFDLAKAQHADLKGSAVYECRVQGSEGESR